MDTDVKLKLRPLLLMKTSVEGKDYIVAQDQSGESQPVLLPMQLEQFLMLLDGKNTLRDIQVELTRSTGGQLVPIDEISKIADELDAHMLLDSPRYRETAALDERFWNQWRLRKPFHAGQAYPAEPEELNAMIDELYRKAGAGGEAEGGATAPFVRGLLAPHIDVKSGGPVFAIAYDALRKAPPAELYVLLGTAHKYSPGPFSVTRKDYVTPIGILETDNDFVDRLLSRYSPPWITDDVVHRTEHSIEFQTIFLKHLLGGDSDAKVVPILVGGFGEFVNERLSPYDDEEVRGFIDALREVIDEDERKVVFIVGGDLAHIGPRYGDTDAALPTDIEDCKKKDAEMLEEAAKGAEEFFNYVARENDRRNICGMPPLYTMLKLIEGASGEIIKVDHWYDQATRSAVTFAAMTFG